MRPLLVVLLVLSVSAVAAAEKNKWQTGKVLDVSRETLTTPGVTTTTGKADKSGKIQTTTTPTTTESQRWTYLIEDEKYTYVLEHILLWRWSKECRLIVGGPVQFEVRKRDGWIKDEDGKVHKLSLVKQTIKSKD